MRYMMLIYTKEGDRTQMSPETAQQIRDAHAAVMRETRERGMLVAVNGLGRTNTATTVRLEAGQVLATDGPFAETKEQLGGYYLIEAANIDEAATIAAGIPGARYGCIEVRPIMVF